MNKSAAALMVLVLTGGAIAAPQGISMFLQNGLGDETPAGGLVLLRDSSCSYLGELKRTPREPNGLMETVAQINGMDIAIWSISIKEKICQEKRSPANLTVVLPFSPAAHRSGAGYRAGSQFFAVEVH